MNVYLKLRFLILFGQFQPQNSLEVLNIVIIIKNSLLHKAIS